MFGKFNSPKLIVKLSTDWFLVTECIQHVIHPHNICTKGLIVQSELITNNLKLRYTFYRKKRKAISQSSAITEEVYMIVWA